MPKGFSRIAISGCLGLLVARSPQAWAQAAPAPQPLTRAQAIQSALERGARIAAARADTLLAHAQGITARLYPDPSLSASYSKDAPNYHVTMQVPIDLPGIRNARVGAAEQQSKAAKYRYDFERASVVLDADTTYTRAQAAEARADLSRRNAQDADSLLRMAITRRDAGDASDLDVELARVNAGQQANAAAADSIDLLSTVLELQERIGQATDHVAVMPSDSMSLPSTAEIAAVQAASTLPVVAAQASLQSAEATVRLQHRSVFSAPSIVFGFDTGDPTGAEPGVLPTFGIGLPLPFFNRNRGAIAEAEAARDRAQADLAAARFQAETDIARTTRERTNALSRVQRDRDLVTSANRVATMALTAYREGAAPIASVLEAQRNARDILANYIEDLTQAWISTATLRVLTLTPGAQ